MRVVWKIALTSALSAMALSIARDESHYNIHPETIDVSKTEIIPSPGSMHHGGHHNRTSILEDPNLEPQQLAYWKAYDPTTFLSAKAPHKFFLYAHIATAGIAWIIMYPISLALGVAQSRLHLPFQTIQFVITLVSLLCLGIYGKSAPRDLYPGNSYSKMSFAMLFICIIHWLALVVMELAKWAMGSPIDGADYVLANLDPSSRPHRGHFIRPSQDSGLGLEENSTSQDDREINNDDPEDMRLYGEPSDTSFEAPRCNKLFEGIMANKKINSTVSYCNTAAQFLFAILNRPLLVIGLSYLLLGTVTCFRLGISNKVYNVLAHFIKGAIFFLYGVLTLLRYLGAFADRGMAWNIQPNSSFDPSRSKVSITAGRYSKVKPLRLLSYLQIPTMEFVECGLIFIYGCSNVFMEHLGNTDGRWSHKDLQHVSIAFMYFGAGLSGLLIESKLLRRLVNRSISTSNNDADDDFHSGMKGNISVNPMPALTVFCTGMLMSQHEQMLPLSTSIHMQWGYLLSVAALFRLGTYTLILISPPKSTVPSRPPTELLASFCLLCGGLVFMQSNSETVEAMMYRALDSMFTLNVNVGITALIMSWIMVVMAIKAWATKRQARLAYGDA